MRNWRNSVTAILNTRCSSYCYIISALSTLHRTLRRGTIEREGYTIRGEEYVHMIVRPDIGPTTLLAIVREYRSSHYCRHSYDEHNGENRASL